MRRWFPWLAGATAVAAYLQIALGGLVRTSGSGLGCQDQWPLCNGRPYPGWEVHAIIEYAHRTFGALTSVLMLATFVAALMLWRRRPVLAWAAGGALAAVALEIPLGALVVFRDLAGFLVMAHLAVAMLILGLLLAAAVAGLDRPVSARPPAGAAIATAGLAFAVLLTGGLVVATEADERCHAWPLCGGGWAFDLSWLGAVTLLHRLSVFLLVAVAAYAAWRAWRTRALATPAWSLATLAVILVQAGIGALAVGGDSVVVQGLHVAMAAATWGVAAVAALHRLRPLTASAASGDQRREDHDQRHQRQVAAAHPGGASPP